MQFIVTMSAAEESKPLDSTNSAAFQATCTPSGMLNSYVAIH